MFREPEIPERGDVILVIISIFVDGSGLLAVAIIRQLHHNEVNVYDLLY